MTEQIIKDLINVINSENPTIDRYVVSGEKHFVITNHKKYDICDISVDSNKITIDTSLSPDEFKQLIDLCQNKTVKAVQNQALQNQR